MNPSIYLTIFLSISILIIIVVIIFFIIGSGQEEYVVTPYLTENTSTRDWKLSWKRNFLYLPGLELTKYDEYIQILINKREYIIPIVNFNMISKEFVLILSTNLDKIVIFRSGAIISTIPILGIKKYITRINQWYILFNSQVNQQVFSEVKRYLVEIN